MTFLQQLLNPHSDPLSRLAPEAQKAIDWVVGQYESRAIEAVHASREKSRFPQDRIDEEKKIYADVRQLHARIPALVDADIRRYRAGSTGALEEQVFAIAMYFNRNPEDEKLSSNVMDRVGIASKASGFLADTSQLGDNASPEKRRDALAKLFEQLPGAVREVAKHQDLLFAGYTTGMRAFIKQNLKEVDLQCYGHFARAAFGLVTQQTSPGQIRYLTNAEIAEGANRIVQKMALPDLPEQRGSSHSR